MKAAPISITGENIAKMTNPGRTEYEFVFGSQQWLTCDAPKKRDPYEGMSSLQRSMMQMKVNDDPNEIDLDEDMEKEKEMDETRTDEDGVVIFPSSVLCELIG